MTKATIAKGTSPAAALTMAPRKKTKVPQQSSLEIADRNSGFKAGASGKPNNDKKSEAWQRGWADAQE